MANIYCRFVSGDSVEQDLSLGGIIQAAQKLDRTVYLLFLINHFPIHNGHISVSSNGG